MHTCNKEETHYNDYSQIIKSIMNNIQPISLPRLKNGQHHNFMRQVNERLATLAQVVDTLPRQASTQDDNPGTGGFMG